MNPRCVVSHILFRILTESLDWRYKSDGTSFEAKNLDELVDEMTRKTRDLISSDTFLKWKAGGLSDDDDEEVAWDLSMAFREIFPIVDSFHADNQENLKYDFLNRCKTI